MSPETTSEFESTEHTDTVTELKTLRRAIRLLPNVPEYRLKLAHALLGIGDLDAAIEECRSAILLEQNLGRAHLQLGLLLSAKQDWQAAASALEEAIRQEPNLPLAHYGLGNVRYALGDVATAIHSYRRALELHPHFLDAHYHLGLLLRVTGKLREAVRHLEAAAIGGVPQARLFLGNAYKNGEGVEKRLDVAIAWWMQAADLGQQTAADSLSNLRRQALSSASKKPQRLASQKAWRTYRQALWNDFPDLTRSDERQSLGKVLRSQDRPDEAIPVLLHECLAMSEDAHTELAALYEIGWDRHLMPFDKRILGCFEATAADGFAPGKTILSRIYAKGIGVEADLRKAKSMLKGLPKNETRSLLDELGIR